MKKTVKLLIFCLLISSLTMATSACSKGDDSSSSQSGFFPRLGL